MSAARDRKEAAKRLGIRLQMQYRAMLEARDNDEIASTAVELGGTFNENLEFICWVLKEFGGVQQMPFERPKSASVPPTAANDMPAVPSIFLHNGDDGTAH